MCENPQKINFIRETEIPKSISRQLHLQFLLCNLTDENIHEIKELFFCLYDNENCSEFYTFLLKTATIRPLLHKPLVELFKTVSSSFSYKPHPKVVADYGSFFLWHLFKAGIYTIEEIKDIVLHDSNALRIFAPIFPTEAFEQLGNISTYDFQDDWKFQRERNDYGYSLNTVQYFIKYDMIEEFRDYANNESNHFDMMSDIIVNSNELLLPQQTLDVADFAAIYGAVNCFKYIVMNIGQNIKDCVNGMNAIQGGSLEIIQICHQNGISFSVGTHIALKFYRYEILDWLVLNYDLEFPDAYSCLSQNAMIPFLYHVQNGFDIKSTFPGMMKKTPLHVACENNCYSFAKYLIEEAKLDVNAQTMKHQTPLDIATHSNNIALVKLLIEHGATVDEKHFNILIKIGYLYRNKEMIEYAESISPPTSDIIYKSNYIPHSVKTNALINVRFFYGLGKDINRVITTTPLLIIALENDHIDMVKLLISGGIDLTKKDMKGRTAVSYAKEHGQAEAVEALLAAGASDDPIIENNDMANSLRMSRENSRENRRHLPMDQDDEEEEDFGEEVGFL